MRKTFIVICFFILELHVYSGPYEFNKYFISASQKVKPSVVNIISYTKKSYRNSFKLIKNAYGTGTIISKNGFVVTNNHLVKGSNYFRIIDSQGNKYDVKKFGNGRMYLADPKTDLAVLKIFNYDKKFKPVKMVDSRMLVEGEWVLAVGNPYGLKQSITAGIVSSKGRDNIGFTDIEDFIQTDVSINPGNSGGPLVNLYGEMVGINAAIRTESGGFQGISFSIPSNIVKRVCFDLIKFGRVKRGWLGFIAAEKKNKVGKSDKRIEIISVIKKSPSETAGIRVGDLIKEIDGRQIDSLGALIRAVGNKTVNSRIKIVLSRQGKLIDVGLLLREKRDYVRMKRGLDEIFSNYGVEFDSNSSTNSIVVSYISPGSPFRQLKRGDIIMTLNRQKLSNIDRFVKYFNNIRGRNFVFEVLRESGVYEVEIRN